MPAVGPTQFWMPEHWAVVGAVLGRGTLLCGRSEERNRAVVIAAPGISLESPEDWSAASTTDGWRIADFYCADGPVFIDCQAPHSVRLTSLMHVAELVVRQAPQHGTWFADHLERQIRRAALTALHASGAGAAGRASSDGARARVHHAESRALVVRDMLDELDAAYSRLAELMDSADPRLSLGVLRRLAEDLAEFSTAVPIVGQADAPRRDHVV